MSISPKKQECRLLVFGRPIPDFAGGLPTEADVVQVYMYWEKNIEGPATPSKILDKVTTLVREHCQSLEQVVRQHKNVKEKVQILMKKVESKVDGCTNMLDEPDKHVPGKKALFKKPFDIELKNRKKSEVAKALDFYNDANDPDYDPTTDEAVEYNLAKYPETIAVALSCGLSNRMTAKLINAIFVDLKLDLYVSPEKIRALKKKHLQALNQKHEEETKNLVGIGVDGKCGMVKEIHCQSSFKDKQTVTNSINGSYLDHGIPTDGKAKQICEVVYQILLKYESTETLAFVNMDGCKVNSGCHKGVIRHLEAKLERPLTWIICSLHGNELVFNHLFEAIGEFIVMIPSFLGL